MKVEYPDAEIREKLAAVFHGAVLKAGYQVIQELQPEIRAEVLRIFREVYAEILADPGLRAELKTGIRAGLLQVGETYLTTYVVEAMDRANRVREPAEG